MRLSASIPLIRGIITSSTTSSKFAGKRGRYAGFGIVVYSDLEPFPFQIRLEHVEQLDIVVYQETFRRSHVSFAH